LVRASDPDSSGRVLGSSPRRGAINVKVSNC